MLMLLIVTRWIPFFSFSVPGCYCKFIFSELKYKDDSWREQFPIMYNSHSKCAKQIQLFRSERNKLVFKDDGFFFLHYCSEFTQNHKRLEEEEEEHEE